MKILVGKITDFLSATGLDVRFGSVTAETFLPGLQIKKGSLIIDTDRLIHPGDILHEAGHLACMPPHIRREMDDDLEPGDLHNGGEMMAIAWSYAACLHLDIDPAVVFHQEGYKGGSQSILDNFSRGNYFGVSLLQWCGMTDDFPVMRSWTCISRPA